jgi:NAD(P)H-hydrate epimerase
MEAVNVEEMREIEHRAMDAGVSEAELMEKAGFALGQVIGIQFPEVGTAVAYIGKGHNAGDTLIALRVLQDKFGWDVGVRAAFSKDDWAELTRNQWDALELDSMLEPGFEKQVFGPLLLLDGLLGIGAKGSPREPLDGLVEEMESLRQTCGATVAAVDLPTGVDPDSGEVYSGAVTADWTFMIGAAKAGLLKGSAVNATGSLAVVAVEGLDGGGESGLELICPQSMNFGKAPRSFDFHKGRAGRIGILAGSVQFTGAALISTLGAIRAGGGLVTLYAREECCAALRSRLPLEGMLKVCDDPTELLDEKLDAIVVGPGLGEMSDDFEQGLLELISKSEVPMVIDADGLNLLAKNDTATDARHVLTPHPGEFARLASELADLDREESARKFVEDTKFILILKGARTIVARDGKPLRINSTGTPAMSNGGQGDLLSGVIGALLAGGMETFDASALAVWLCGRAAELTVSEQGEVCTATDTAKNLPSALRDWKRSSR